MQRFVAIRIDSAPISDPDTVFAHFEKNGNKTKTEVQKRNTQYREARLVSASALGGPFKLLELNMLRVLVVITNEYRS